MRIDLGVAFTVEQKNYIDYYLTEVIEDNTSLFIYTGQESLLCFLKQLSHPNSLAQDTIPLSPHAKQKLATQLIQCIMNDEHAFIDIILTNSSFFRALCVLPLLGDSVEQLVATVVSAIERNKEVRETFFASLMDINRVLGINQQIAMMFMELLLNTNELQRFINSPKQLCVEINRFPELYEFFIQAALSNNKFFALAFPRKEDLFMVKHVLEMHGLSISPACEKIIETRISKLKPMMPRQYGTFFQEDPLLQTDDLNNASTNRNMVIDCSHSEKSASLSYSSILY